MPLRFLHFSDIHFGQERNGVWEPHDDVRREVIADIRKVRGNGLISGAATGVLVTGDIAQAGKEAEFKRASEWLAQVMAAADCPANGLRAVPGNHDCDLDQLGREGLQLQQMLRRSSIEEVYSYLASVGGKADHVLLRKLSEYRSFAYAHGTDFNEYSQPVAISHYELPPGKGIRIVGLCTVILSDRTDASGAMILGRNQFAMSRDDKYEDIVMMHHPTAWMKDHEEAERYLNSRARVLMTGHEHKPALTRIEYEHGWHQLQLAAGATNPPQGEAGFQYCYNWIEFDWQIEDGQTFLSVTVFPRVWVPQSTAFDSDFQRLNGAQKRQILLACGAPSPLGEALEQPETSQPAQEPSDEPVASTLSTAPEDAMLSAPDTDLVPQNVTDQTAFERLRYLFWKYLTRQQRIDTLVRLRLLTEVARVRPPPEVFERQAFDDASQTGQLGDLWDETMAFVPIPERKDNPFRDGADAR